MEEKYATLPSFLVRSLPIVDFLALDYQYVRSLAARGVRERLPTTLNCLVYVQLYDICFEELDEPFHGATAAIDAVVEHFDLQGWSDVCLNKLLFVDMEKVSGTKAEMEFIKLLLAKSPRLHTPWISS
ncbi:hypothetical protein Vadar_030449 [Vaccinium darrowii]|uniref:Uncharacterized protein n=1 Tax=Vaccinium darrowii TaxID=229202 RepID=A0ACB7X551_9ERIC|nr:hypothetical protein Vadar_030449 [Vaccinium darrowii]